jgi:hypothetical protein
MTGLAGLERRCGTQEGRLVMPHIVHHLRIQLSLMYPWVMKLNPKKCYVDFFSILMGVRTVYNT